jgi:hypothetical protein
MRAGWLIVAALVTVTPLVWTQQNSSFPDLSDFTKSPTEHVINTIDQPFHVHTVDGVIGTVSDDYPPGPAGIIFEIEGPGAERRVRRALTDKHGRFKISDVPKGTYRFKATLNAFQSVIGTIIVQDRLKKSDTIKIVLHVGV